MAHFLAQMPCGNMGTAPLCSKQRCSKRILILYVSSRIICLSFSMDNGGVSQPRVVWEVRDELSN